MIIGQRIKEQRSKLGLSQQELAVKLELSIDTIRSLETNRAKPSVETLKRLSDLFGCSTDYLLGLVDRDITYFEVLQMLRASFDDTGKKEIDEFLKLAEQNKVPEEHQLIIYKLLDIIATRKQESDKIKQETTNHQEDNENN